MVESDCHRGAAGVKAFDVNPHSQIGAHRQRHGVLLQLARALKTRWWWVLAGTIGAGAAGFVGGFTTGWLTATAELEVPDLPGSLAAATTPKPTRESAPQEAVAGLARSDLVVRRTAEASGLAGRTDRVRMLTEVSVRPEVGLVTIKARGSHSHDTVRLANTYAEQIIAVAREVYGQRTRQATDQLQRALAAVDAELDQASQQLAEFQRRSGGVNWADDAAAPVRQLEQVDQRSQTLRGQLAGLELQIKGLVRELATLSPALVATRDALAQALTRYTEEHPRVKELRATVAALEAQLTAPSGADSLPPGTLASPAAASVHLRLAELKNQEAALVHELEGLILQRQQLQSQVKALAELQTEQVRLKSRFDALKERRFALARSLEALSSGATQAGCARIVCRATADSLSWADKVRRGGWGGAAGAMLGLAGGGLLALRLPRAGRIRSSCVLAEVAQMPLLGTLDDVNRMSAGERQHWAFRMFTRLRTRIAGGDGQPLVCGFISASPGEGRSTWIGLLADAARQQGYHVVTLDISRHGQPDTERHSEAAKSLPIDATPTRWVPELPPSESSLPARRWEAALPAAWAWDPDHRAQWRAALRQWQNAPRTVVFIELPPACCPEAMLLAERMPNLVWLTQRAAARAAEIRRHLDALREVGAGLVGCVFNRARPRRRVLHRFVVLGLLGLWAGVLWGSAAPGRAQETNLLVPGPVPVTTNRAQTLSISTTDQLAEWQKRFTLGPGDTFDISLYERPETARQGITIGPDGRINYLEARDVMAAGLAIDELRAKLEEILSKYHRAPRVVINPTAFVSKKYYVLGNVNGRGVYPLDRPISLIEAVARAKGFVMAFPQQQTWPQADFGRSFLIRRRSDGTFGRVPVDFEALFLEGDLSQNIALEPDDYLFFPPLEAQEVYVLGEVNGPGPLPYTPNLTVLGAIAARGGFTTRAYKSKVLVVRGSLSRPETFVVNVADVLKARALDFRLQNRDIVYVHERPFARAEELAEQAALTFVQSLATGWANLKVFGRIRR